jgi:hypothetical protein
VRTPRVLAFGQNLRRPWQMESFLLLEDQSGGISLAQWLGDNANGHWTAELKRRWRVLRQAGTMLRRMHDACCYLPERLDGSLQVDMKSALGPVLALSDLERVLKRRKPSRTLAKHNLIALARNLGLARLSRTDWLRLVLSYAGQKHLTAATKKLARDLEK